jgi:hypothetical protein
MNSPATPVFAAFAPAQGYTARAGANIGGSLKAVGQRAWRGAGVGLEVVLDGDIHGAIEAVALIAVIASTAWFTLAAFGAPVGLD